MSARTGSPSIVVLGGINMGLITKSSRLPMPGETLRGERFHSSSGGKGATQAVAAARLGARVRMVGKVGNDLFGPVLVDALLNDNIEVSGISVDTDNASGIGVIILDADGQNHVLATYGANLLCDDEQVRVVEESLHDVDTLMLQMEIPFEVSMKAARAAKRCGIRVLLDPAPAADIPLEAYPYIDVISPNQNEAGFHTGIAVTNVQSATAAAAVLLERGVSVAIIKMGELGTYFASSDGSGFVPPFSVKVVDTTSAGDAFHGALAVALSEGKQLEDAVRFGAAAGALAVTMPGVQDSMPVRAKVRALLASTTGL